MVEPVANRVRDIMVDIGAGSGRVIDGAACAVRGS